MPWKPKNSNPEVVSLGQAFGALVSGDQSLSWLATFIPLVQDIQINVADLCAAGPPPDPELIHLPIIGPAGLRLPPVPDVLYIAQRIQQVAMARVFGAYCMSDLGPGGVAGGCVNFGPFTTPAASSVVFSDYYCPVSFEQLNVEWAGGPPCAVQDYILDYPGHVIDFTEHTLGPDFLGYTRTIHCPANSRVQLVSGGGFSTGTQVNFSLCGLGADIVGDTPFTQTPQGPPSGWVPPVAGSYPDLPAVGRELDAQELKLDAILAFLMQSNIIIPPVGAPDPPPAALPINPAVPIVIPPDALGIVVTLTSWPGWTSEVFSVPPRLYKVGRVVFSGLGADGPAFDIEYAHQRFAIPPHTDTVSLLLPAGVHGDYQVIRPPSSV